MQQPPLLSLCLCVLCVSAAPFDYSMFSIEQAGFINLAGSAHLSTCTGRIPDIQVDRVNGLDYEKFVQFNYASNAIIPDQFTSVNYTITIFQEVKRRKAELAAQLEVAEKDVAFHENRTSGVEPDNKGQVWVLVRTKRVIRDKIKEQLDAMQALDLELWQTRRIEYDIVLPTLFTCKNVIRLTAGTPFESGAIWHYEKHKLQEGFNATFSFILTAKSMKCENTERATSLLNRGAFIYTRVFSNCEEVGGDGFAFVIHNSPDGINALGGSGSGMGYDGIFNSIAIEFDTFYNAEREDPSISHITVQAAGPNAPTSPNTHHRLATAPLTPRIDDGQYHTAHISFSPGLDFEGITASAWHASPHLMRFIKEDNLGMFRVYIDDMSESVINFPVSFNQLIDLGSDGMGYIGFTSATGHSFQVHDITKWKFESKFDPETTT